LFFGSTITPIQILGKSIAIGRADNRLRASLDGFDDIQKRSQQIIDGHDADAINSGNS
jgi:hypothetical protein